mmetsp:Transcript_43013/g.69312  ORF Transcript_43013/g.69312 Transcript_43013/m.69312 type:complete len:513 (-) Transcript_43013:75-1613(-)
MKMKRQRILYLFPDMVTWATPDAPTKAIRQLPISALQILTLPNKPTVFQLKHKNMNKTSSSKTYEFHVLNAEDMKTWTEAFSRAKSARASNGKGATTDIDDVILSARASDSPIMHPFSLGSGKEGGGISSLTPATPMNQSRKKRLAFVDDSLDLERNKNASRGLKDGGDDSKKEQQQEEATTTPKNQGNTQWTYGAVIAEIATQMESETGLDIKDRKYHFKKYEQCFVGSEAVSWIVSSGFAKNRADAVILGNAVMRKGYFSHVTQDHRFRDKEYFYRLNSQQIKDNKKSRFILKSLAGVHKKDASLWAQVFIKVAWKKDKKSGAIKPVFQCRKVGGSESKSEAEEQYNMDILLPGGYILPSSDNQIFKFKGISTRTGLSRTIHIRCHSEAERDKWVKHVKSLIATEKGKLGFASTLLEFHETRVAAFTKLARNIDILSILKHDPLERCPPFCRDNMTLLTDIRAEVHKGIKLWLRTLLLSNWHQNYEYALDIIDFASVKALPSNSLNQVEA